jgi:hypothetical protein
MEGPTGSGDGNILQRRCSKAANPETTNTSQPILKRPQSKPQDLTPRQLTLSGVVKHGI